MDIPADIREYLSATTQSFQSVLRDKLLGLYLCGSLVQDDFKTDRSDIDLLGVVSGQLDKGTRAELDEELCNAGHTIPARGLEVVLFPAHAARSPGIDLPFEYALSTGPGWETESEQRGIANDMLIDIVLCRNSGFALAGPPAKEAFGPVSEQDLRNALIDELQWHVREVDKGTDDIAAVNAILNAARSLYAAETGQILSKTEGGNWWLQRHPSDSLVAQALARRADRQATPPNPGLVNDFVKTVIDRIIALQG